VKGVWASIFAIELLECPALLVVFADLADVVKQLQVFATLVFVGAQGEELEVALLFFAHLEDDFVEDVGHKKLNWMRNPN
jgi:hypothetical protein